MYEGCGYSTLTFSLPYPSDELRSYNYNIQSSYSFVNGVDIEPLSGYLEFPAGVTLVELDVIPLLDHINEDSEILVFNFPFSNSCEERNDISITVNNYNPIEIIVPAEQNLCAGERLILDAQIYGGAPPYNISWEYLDQFSSSETIEINIEKGTNIAFFNIEDACGYSENGFVEITGNGADEFSIVWPPSNSYACFGDNSEIELIVEGGLAPLTFEWYLNGQSIEPAFQDLMAESFEQDNIQPVLTMPPSVPYTHNYQVIVTDSCSNQIDYNIDVLIEDCVLPTSFTPNGDQNNDVFWVDFGNLVGEVSLEVFNRWGALVYMSQDYTNCLYSKTDCWDGNNFKNANEPCMDGIYYYVFTYSSPIHNTDSYDVSKFEENFFGGPHKRNLGIRRTGSLLLIR